MRGPSRVNPWTAALATATAACALVAPALLVALLAARPPIAAAAGAYRASATCAGPASRGLPPPEARISEYQRTGSPCAMTGAIVVEKDTLSQGAVRATRYALGLRTDAGATFFATLAGPDAVEAWNRIQAGERVVVQTYAGRPTLVGDGIRTAQTEADPVWIADSNGIAVALSGGVVAIEAFAAFMVAAWWRRSRSSVN